MYVLDSQDEAVYEIRNEALALAPTELVEAVRALIAKRGSG